jgi:glycosyltransferase involved in cell wall biosynthesis
MKRRVLLLSYCLDYGGSERQLAEIARSMDPDTYEMHVGCLECSGLREPELRAAGIPIVQFPMRSFFSFDAVVQSLRLVSYIHRHKIDLVHAFDVPMDIFGAPAAKLSLRPVVLTSQRAHRSLTQGARLRILRATDHIADGIVVNCETIRRHLIEDEHVRADRIHLCYNGLDEKFFAFRERGEAEGITIGCVCALRPEKNLALLIDAFFMITRVCGGCRLLLVGSGPSEAALKELVARKELQGLVTFVPANSDVPGWLDQIDIFVLPSKTEAFSNSLMEAMACGCAVIASDVGGNPELIGKDERGLLFQEGNLTDLVEKLAGFVKLPELRRNKARAARAFVEEKLTLRASVARMAEIYEQFLK